MAERGPNRRFELDKNRYAEIVVGEPIERDLSSLHPGEVRVHRRRDGKPLDTIPLQDAQFAIFGVREDDPEVKELKSIIPHKLKTA